MLQLPSDLAQQVTTALAEDIGGGDITAQLVPAAQRVTGSVITREEAT
jgi:nicotinate-nucleotide pyrophosphorylase (carboxylating)